MTSTGTTETTTRSKTTRRRRSLVSSVLVLALLGLGSTAAPTGGAGAQTSSPSSDEQALVAEFGSAPTVLIDPDTDQVSFVAASGPAGPSARGGGDPASIAGSFVADHAAALSAGQPGNDLVPTGASDSLAGGTSVAFEQTHNGIPVVGGEVKVVVDRAGAVRSISADLAPDLDLDTTPRVTAGAARTAAGTSVAKNEGLGRRDVSAGPAELAIYNSDVLGGPGDGRNHLVWQTEVTSSKAPFRYLVLVDAELGNVAVSYDQVNEAKDRNVCDWNNVVTPENSCLLPTYDRTEAGAASGVLDVETTFIVSGDVYDFFFDAYGRDSYDGAGASMIGNARYCRAGSGCPYANAFWNGTQIHLGNGFAAADDVVAHEWGHAYTERTSGLRYYYESGAMNEAFSDVWGELIDLSNTTGTDTAAVRWLMGEDVPGFGAIRDMQDPPVFSDPDRMQSALYVHTAADSGGVHSNSGVMNKAAYLMVDGDTFNGVTVSAIGATKTAAIFWEVGNTLLTSASDYQILDLALVAACNTLVGGAAGITAADCIEVSDATDATEMHLNPIGHPVEAGVCGAGTTQSMIFSDDMENTASGNWVANNVGDPDTRFYYPQNTHPYTGFNATYATSGVTNAWAYNSNNTGDGRFAMTADIAIPAGDPTYFRFNHSYAFEAPNWDGGVVEYSTDGGTNWLDAGTLFVDNGYSGTIRAGTPNPLTGRVGFIDNSRGMTSSRIDLSSLAGSNVRLRFRLGSDDTIDALGWFIDDVHLYQCQTPVATTTITDVAFGLHTCVAFNDYTDCDGLNNYGQANPPQGGVYSDVTAGTYFTCGIRTSDALVDCWGLPNATSPPPGAFNSIEAGWSYTCGITFAGTVSCWGGNPKGAATPLAGTFTAISAGTDHTCGIRTNQTLACWGDNSFGKATPPAGTYTHVSVGREFACATRTDGVLRCWGRNNLGQRNPPGGTFAQISAGQNQSCAMTTGDAISCWGTSPAPPGGTFSQIESAQKGICAISNDRESLTCWGTVPPLPPIGGPVE